MRLPSAAHWIQGPAGRSAHRQLPLHHQRNEATATKRCCVRSPRPTCSVPFSLRRVRTLSRASHSRGVDFAGARIPHRSVSVCQCPPPLPAGPAGRFRRGPFGPEGACWSSRAYRGAAASALLPKSPLSSPGRRKYPQCRLLTPPGILEKVACQLIPLIHKQISTEPKAARARNKALLPELLRLDHPGYRN
jgi:hypothetical protein